MEPTENHKIAGQHPTPEKEAEGDSTAPKVMQSHLMKIIPFALMEAAGRYREAFWRQDIEAYRKHLEVLENKTGSFSQTLKAKKETLGKVKAFELKITKFNAAVDAELMEFNRLLSKQNRVNFDNYATAYGLLAEEMMKARNTTDLLVVCQMYNAGQMDAALKIIKDMEAEKLNERFEVADKNNVGEPIDIPNPDVKLEIVRDEEIGPEN